MKLLVRADAGIDVGTGHVMRALALAQGWRRRGGEVRLLAAGLTQHLQTQLTQHEVQVEFVRAEPGSEEDADTAKALAERWGADWVVLDGYRFGASYQERLESDAFARLVVDDYGHAERYAAEIVLNQNLYADLVDYGGRAGDARLLLGPSFALLRKEFWPWRSWKRPPPETPSRVLLTMGGTDPGDATGQVLKVLRSRPQLEIVAVVGGANPRTYAEQTAKPRVRIKRNVSTMPQHMCWAHLGFAAGGTTALELLFMQLPGAYAVLADNQVRVVDSLEQLGMGLSLGTAPLDAAAVNRALDRLLGDAKFYRVVLKTSVAVVDGWGVERVIDAMLGRAWELRPATAEDAEVLWRWANDPATRAASLSPEVIPWPDHLQWLAMKLEDPNAYIWLAVGENGQPLGQVRFDRSGSEAVVSVGLDPDRRGTGLGSQLIQQSTERLMRTEGVSLVRAYIKPDNHASRRAFARAGYKEVGEAVMKGQTVVEMVYSAKEVDCEV